MQVIEPLHHCLDAYPVPDYLCEVDIAIEVSKIVPGWFFGIHPLRQNGQLIEPMQLTFRALRKYFWNIQATSADEPIRLA